MDIQMRLSDAIATGRVTIENVAAHDIRRCAFAMAANAIGVGEFESTTDCAEKLKVFWPWLAEISEPHCEDCVPPGRTVKGLPPSRFVSIFWFFDRHVMILKDKTLDEMIDWLRCIEPESVARSQPELVEELSTV